LFFIIFCPISKYNLTSIRYITLDENFLCCSRLHYENFEYKSEQCTYEGEIKGYDGFVSNKCNTLKPPSTSDQSTLTPDSPPRVLSSSSQSNQVTTLVIPPPSSTPRTKAVVRISADLPSSPQSNQATTPVIPPPSSTSGTAAAVRISTGLPSSSQSNQAATPVIPPPSSTPRAAAAFRISNYVGLALCLVLSCFS
jgi:hypothetical protein